MSVEDAFTYYNLYANNDLFPNMKVRLQIANLVLDKIEELPADKKKKMIVERVLAQTYDAWELQRISGIRGRAIEMYTNQIASDIGGLDDDSDTYLQKIMAEIAIIQHKTSDRNLFDITNKIGDKTVSQEKLSIKLGEIGKPVLSRHVAMSSISIKGAETLYAFLASDERGRRHFIDFLTSPLTQSACESFAEDLQGTGYRGRFAMYSHEISRHDLLERLDMQDIPDGEVYKKLSTVLWDVHSNFWQQSMPVRTILMDYILVPSKQIANDPLLAYEEAADIVLDKLFPLQTKKPDVFEMYRDPFIKHITGNVIKSPYEYSEHDSQNPWKQQVILNAVEACYELVAPKKDISEDDAKWNRWSRSFLKTYLKRSHETERTLILSAMMSAAEQLEGEGASFGKRLGLVIDAMANPAYWKLGQAIHSHLSTPQDIKDGLKHTKSKAGIWRRCELFERINEVVPDTERSEYEWVGPIVGGASFFVNCDVKVDGEIDKLGLLRKNALRDATAGFDKLEACADELAKNEPEFAKHSDVIIEMIRQAREMTYVETNLEIASKQAAVAQTQYDGLELDVDNVRVAFRQAAWRVFGREFRRTASIDGVHFNELPDTTPQERDQKKRFAKASVSVELFNILSGQEFDVDRHGEQCRISVNQVGVFDHGGLTLEKPTDQEKQLLGQTLGNIFAGTDNAKDTAVQLVEEIERIRQETGKRPDYLMKVQKALHAMGDYIDYLEEKDMRGIMVSLWKSGAVDTVVRKAMTDTAPALNGADTLLAFKKAPIRRIREPRKNASPARSVA